MQIWERESCVLFCTKWQSLLYCGWQSRLNTGRRKASNSDDKCKSSSQKCIVRSMKTSSVPFSYFALLFQNVWVFGLSNLERSLDVTTTPLLSTPSVICFESKKSLRCTFPPVPNSTIGRQRRKLPSNSFSSLENWFSKALCHRYFSCVLCVMVSIYSFKRRHFYLSQLFKKGSTDIPFNLSLASIPER